MDDNRDSIQHKNQTHVQKQLSFVDRFLTVWIISAIILGVLIGYFSPNAVATIDSWSTGGVNLPIAIGLIVMMFPPLARVNYDRVYSLILNRKLIKESSESSKSSESDIEMIKTLLPSDPNCKDKCVCHDESSSSKKNHSLSMKNNQFYQLIGASLCLNWIIGPLLMFFLAVACLPDHLPYVRGLILIGLARCIAMVIVWNDLADGSNEFCAILVTLNSMFQIITYSPMAYFFLQIFLPIFHLNTSQDHDNHVSISFELVVRNVAIYLGIPFGLGFFSWFYFNKILGGRWIDWYKRVFIPYTSPLTLIALLFTIIIMFCLKGDMIIDIPLDVLRVSIPLIIYFFTMFVGTYYLCHRYQFDTEESITLSFTSASNNFELAIAVSIAIFGLNSPEAFAGVIGPLIEVPVMLGFVYLVRYLEQIIPTHSLNNNYNSIPSMNDIMPTKKKILFLCTGNSCRSQMALGWCNYYHENIFLAYSAGTSPEPNHPGSINPHAITVMMENGIDISHFKSKNLLDLQSIDFDYVITVCDDAYQTCPLFTSSNKQHITKILHQSFNDPPRLEALLPSSATDDEKLDLYRNVCQDIRYFIRDDLLILCGININDNNNHDYLNELSLMESNKNAIPMISQI